MTTAWIFMASLLVACSDKGDDSAGGDDGSGDDGSGDDSDTLPSEDADSDGFVAGDDCNDERNRHQPARPHPSGYR